MREPKASPSSSAAFAMPDWEEEGTFDSVSAHLLATAANIFGWAGDPTEEEVASAIKGGLRHTYRANISWSASAGRRRCCCVHRYKTPRPCLPSCGKSLFWMCTKRRTCHLDEKWQEVHVSLGLVQLCIVLSPIGVGVTATRSVRWCFLQLGKTYSLTKWKLGIPKDFVERSILSFCCRALICDLEVRASRACPSKPPDKNQSITYKS